jgi:hypothetical protein
MSDIYGEDIYTTGIDYALPLFYPDWNMGPLAYFKRIKMNAFFDYGYQKGKISDMNQNLFSYKDAFTSFGAELSSDLHVLRFSAPLNLGIRLGYEDQTGSMFANFLISFNLSAF